MAPKPGQGVEEAEEDALLCPTERESVSGHLGPPAGAPAAPETPTCLPDTTPHPTRAACSADLQLALESLDPRTLRLLWRQRELEIQALRWAVQNGKDTRLCHILEEVAGIPPNRSSHSQEKFLQNQVQKLTLQLKEQKERAQWEKEHLEERLLQTTRTLQEVEAELQNLQKSCLLQLARSSWVGRILRSQTGSVEVVTAETLMDPSDLSENIQAPTGEGFRLEDVDWNSIAHRYPNLFINMEPSSKQKQPRPWPQLDTGSSESSGKHSERHHKTVEWGCLPCLNTSSSGGADSDSSSCRPGLPSLVQVVGHPPRDHRASSKQALVQARSSSRDLEDLQKTHSRRHGEPVLAPQPCTDPDGRSPEHLQSPTGLKIVAVSCREKFVRIFNPSLESTADLSCMVLKQLVRGLPERLYRFPPGTLLAPRHHITVWGEGTRSAKKPPRASSGREPVPLLSSRGCATLLLSPKGEVGAGPRGGGQGWGVGLNDAPCRSSVSTGSHAARLRPGGSSMTAPTCPLTASRSLKSGPALTPASRRAHLDPCAKAGCGSPGSVAGDQGGDRGSPGSGLPPQAPPQRNGAAHPRARTAPNVPRPRPGRSPVPPGRPAAPAQPQARSPLGPPFPGRPPPSRPSPHQDAGPAAPNELGETLPRAGGARAARDPRDPRAAAPAHHPR
uniref:Lamin tail domain containing 2 n=1 Tax=Piliocolobus tephrosceles TaxID=591936 RepID=A0A8C9HCV3_9PRIM